MFHVEHTKSLTNVLRAGILLNMESENDNTVPQVMQVKLPKGMRWIDRGGSSCLLLVWCKGGREYAAAWCRDTSAMQFRREMEKELVKFWPFDGERQFFVNRETGRLLRGRWFRGWSGSRMEGGAL
jgi:hypothetical protein